MNKSDFEEGLSNTFPLSKYDEKTCVTAGELRVLGITLSSNIPDYAWVPRAKTTLVPVEVEKHELIPKIQRVIWKATISEPFRWHPVDRQKWEEGMAQVTLRRVPRAIDSTRGNITIRRGSRNGNVIIGFYPEPNDGEVPEEPILLEEEELIKTLKFIREFEVNPI